MTLSLVTNLLTTLSADSLKTWDTCPQQFEWKTLNQLHWPSDTRNFVLGTSIHKLIDCQARGLDVEPLISAADGNIQATWHLLQRHPSVQWQVVASEWGFELPLTLAGQENPIWVTGRIDRIAWHQNQLWVIDWKTGTAAPRNPEKAWQTGIYALALQQAWQHLPAGPWSAAKPSQVNVAYIAVAPPDIRQLTVRFGPPELQYWQNRLETTVTTILQSPHFKPLPQCPDKWCAFQPVCPSTKLS